VIKFKFCPLQRFFSSMESRDTKTLVLFDVDGTLTPPRLQMLPNMRETLRLLSQRVMVGIIGGSDHAKVKEQLGNTDIEQEYDYVFTENGLVAFCNGVPLPTTSIKTVLGDDKLKKFINFVLHYIADLDIPIKRGTFIEFRNGMLNVSPIGRNCTYEERLGFLAYDKEHGVRAKMVQVLEEKFADYNFKYSIGGQISFDVFPVGWDKTFCLRHVQKADFQTIHFFGDMTHEGGNDYELFSSPAVLGHTVTSPEDTIAQVTKLFLC